MKKTVALIISFFVFAFISYWVGHQNGQREMKTLMTAYEASRLRGELYDWVGPARDSDYKASLVSDLNKTLIYYGAYLDGELPFYQGPLKKNENITFLFSRVVEDHREKVEPDLRLSDLTKVEKNIREQFSDRPELAEELIQQNRQFLRAFKER